MITPRRFPLVVALLALGLVLGAAQPAGVAAKTLVTRSGSVITLANRQTSVRYNLDRGLADYTWGERTVIRNAYSSAVLGDGTNRTLYSFGTAPRTAGHELFRDAVGSGIVLRVATSPPG